MRFDVQNGGAGHPKSRNSRVFARPCGLAGVQKGARNNVVTVSSLTIPHNFATAGNSCQLLDDRMTRRCE